MEQGLEGALINVEISVAFSLDGTRAVSTSVDWISHVPGSHSSIVWAVAFSHDGTRVVSGSGDNSAKIRNASTGEVEVVIEGHSDGVSSVAFSRDGTRVVSGSHDKSVRIWNAATGDIELVLKGHSSSVNSVAFSHGGTRVVSGTEDNTGRVWNAATGKAELVLNDHSMSVAFSRDGRRIVSGSWDDTIRIWNAATGEIERDFKEHSYWTQSVAFSPDETHVVAGSFDESVLVWDTITGESTSLPYSESFQFPDKTHVTHILPGKFQLFAPSQKVISLSPDMKLPTGQIKVAGYLQNSATLVYMLFPAPNCVLDTNRGVSSSSILCRPINLTLNIPSSVGWNMAHLSHPSPHPYHRSPLDHALFMPLDCHHRLPPHPLTWAPTMLRARPYAAPGSDTTLPAHI